MSEVHVFTATNANGTSSEFISNKDYLLLKAENAELKADNALKLDTISAQGYEIEKLKRKLEKLDDIIKTVIGNLHINDEVHYFTEQREKILKEIDG